MSKDLWNSSKVSQFSLCIRQNVASFPHIGTFKTLFQSYEDANNFPKNGGNQEVVDFRSGFYPASSSGAGERFFQAQNITSIMYS